jgi:anhydro-N-acetylmuramic acid kinase
MIYRVIGVMSGSSLDGLDIVFAELEESKAKWNYTINASVCYPYNDEWLEKLNTATSLSALDYLLLHSAYGRYLGEKINRFIEDFSLQHQVQLIASHGHTTFHAPAEGMTAQLGDGATIAAVTGINVVSDLRALDVAFGGQGAPIVPMGEKLLLSDYAFLLNFGGIANLSINSAGNYIAFDVCPANRVLNMLAQQEGKPYDEGGEMASKGEINSELLNRLNSLDYYSQNYPKSLANDFGINVIYPLIEATNLSVADALRTYTAHIVEQVVNAIVKINEPTSGTNQMLVTGGGAFNHFLVQQLSEAVKPSHIDVILPEKQLIEYKEALIMALLGVLRWREENTVLSSVTGAVRSSIGGAVWIGQEA